MNQYNPAYTTSSAGPPPSEASSSSARLQLHRRAAQRSRPLATHACTPTLLRKQHREPLARETEFEGRTRRPQREAPVRHPAFPLRLQLRLRRVDPSTPPGETDSSEIVESIRARSLGKTSSRANSVRPVCFFSDVWTCDRPTKTSVRALVVLHVCDQTIRSSRSTRSST